MTVVRISNAALEYEEETGTFNIVTNIDAVLNQTVIPREDVKVVVLSAYLEYDEANPKPTTFVINARLDANIEKRGRGWWKKFLAWLGL